MERWERIIDLGEDLAEVIEEGPCGIREVQFEGSAPIDWGCTLTFYSRSQTANMDFVYCTFTLPTGKECEFTVDYGEREHFPRCGGVYWEYLTEKV